MTAYEGGFERYYFLNAAWAGKACTIDTGTNTLAFATSIDSIFDNGDLISFGGTVPSTGLQDPVSTPPFGGVSANQGTWVRKKDTTHLWCYPSQALYAADTVPNGTGAATLNGTAPGSYTAQNASRSYNAAQRQVTIANSSVGLGIYQTYKSTVYDALGFRHFMQFGDLGYLENATVIGYFGLNFDQYATATPRQSWFRGL
jgi:hypothetical protein